MQGGRSSRGAGKTAVARYTRLRCLGRGRQLLELEDHGHLAASSTHMSPVWVPSVVCANCIVCVVPRSDAGIAMVDAPVLVCRHPPAAPSDAGTDTIVCGNDNAGAVTRRSEHGVEVPAGPPGHPQQVPDRPRHDHRCCPCGDEHRPCCTGRPRMRGGADTVQLVREPGPAAATCCMIRCGWPTYLRS